MSWAFDDLTFYELTFDELGYWAIDVAPLFLSEWYSVFSPPLEERKTFGKCLGSNPDPFANHGSSCTLVYDGASSWQPLRNTKERKSRPCHLNYLDVIRPNAFNAKKLCPNCFVITSYAIFENPFRKDVIHSDMLFNFKCQGPSIRY